jgi:hypothetical protein
MYICEEKQTKLYSRTSKLGARHSYVRTVSVIVFACDNCGEQFKRLRGSMSPKRLNNNYFHCCSNCDSKRFAQKKGVERRMIWDMPASSTLPISRL